MIDKKELIKWLKEKQKEYQQYIINQIYKADIDQNIISLVKITRAKIILLRELAITVQNMEEK